MVDDDYDVKFVHDTAPKANKEHACDECWRTIHAGERYYKTVQKYDKVVTTHKTCSHCKVPVDWLLVRCNGYLFGGVKSDIFRHAETAFWRGEPGESLKLAKWYVGMRRKWKSYKNENALLPIPKK